MSKIPVSIQTFLSDPKQVSDSISKLRQKEYRNKTINAIEIYSKLIDRRFQPIGLAYETDFRDFFITQYAGTKGTFPIFYKDFLALLQVEVTSHTFLAFSLITPDAFKGKFQAIVERFKLISNKELFSYTSKLIHILNPNIPIYDSVIRSYFKNNPPIGFDVIWELYSKEICPAYNELIQNDLGQNAIYRVRTSFPKESPLLTDVKCLDFLLWG